jgi:hypothetical protein
VSDTKPALVHDRTHIDYLRVTHDDGRPLRFILRGPTEKLKGGLGVYPHAERDGHGTVFAAGGPEPRPYMLQLSGKPLAAWRAENQDRDLIFQLAFDGVHCTRVDLARDTSGLWTPYRLREYLDADRYVTPWRTPPLYTQQRNGPLTVQLGSRTSDVMLRCYDKRGELLAKGEACDVPQLSRWELEINGNLAPRAFEQLSMLTATQDEVTGEERWPLERLHSSCLRSRLRLKAEPVDRAGKNQGRGQARPEWLAFLASSNGATLLAGPDERTPAQAAEDFARWFKCLAASIATAAQIAGPEAIAKLIDYGRERLSAKQRMLIERIAETQPAVRGVLDLPGR